MRKLNEDYELPEYSADELTKMFETGELNSVVFTELKFELEIHEHNKITEEVAELTQENMKFGGSEHGYYFDNELYPVGSSYNIGEISPIADELYDRAYGIMQNKSELRQDMTYIGNMMATLTSMSASVGVWLANLPAECSKFSPSIRRLEGQQNKDNPAWRADFKFRRDQPEFANFFLHYDRVEPKVKRYLFRRITS